MHTNNAPTLSAHRYIMLLRAITSNDSVQASWSDLQSSFFAFFATLSFWFLKLESTKPHI